LKRQALLGLVRRPLGRVVLVLVFAFLGGGAWIQAFAILVNRSDSRAIGVFQILMGIAGTAAAVGSWLMARWAPVAALAYGAVSAIMLLSLSSLLKLDPDAGEGLWVGAGAVFLFGLWAAWYLRRLATRSTLEPRTDA
jgi:hypothetical protein